MPDESLKTVLGFEAGGAINTLKALTATINNYNKALFDSVIITQKYNQTAQKTDAQFKKYSAAAKTAGTAQTTLTEKTKKSKKALRDIGDKVEDTGKKTKRLAKETNKAGAQMILTWQSVIRIFTIQVIHQIVSKITSAMRENIAAAIDLEISLAEIQTIGGVLRKDFEGLSKEVRELSDAFGVPAEIVAEGIYQTLSNQVAQAEKAFTFFAAAADFSVAAVTSADASVNLLSSTVNAFGYNATQTRVIAGKLFKTIELGRVRGEEFASTFGRVAVLASRLGVSLEEVLASIATLTIAGLRYNEAFTLINNIMLKLIRPTDAMKAEFASLGIVTAEVGIQAYGFQGLLAKLAESAGESASELGELFGRVRAIRGALGLTGSAAKRFAENLAAIQEAGGETLMEAKEFIFKTNAKQIQIEIEELRNAILFDFGRNAIEVINNVIETFGGLLNIIKILGVGVGVAAAGLVILAAASWPVVTATFALGTAVGGLYYTYKHFTKSAIEGIKERHQAEMKAIAKINMEEAKLAEQRIKYFRGQFANLQKYLIERLAAAHKIKQNAIGIEEFISSNLDQQLDDRKSAFNTFVSSISKSMDQAKDNIKKSQLDIFSLQMELSKEIFEGQQRSRNEIKQALASIQRGVELSRKASREFRSGHQTRARQLFSESRQLLEQAKQTGINIQNVRVERQARETIKDTIQEQIKLQARFTRGEGDRYKALERQLPLERVRAQRITTIIDKIKEFAIFSKKGIIQFATKEEAMKEVKPWLDMLQREFDVAGSKINIFRLLEDVEAQDLQTALLKAIRPLEDVFTGRPISLEFAYKERAHLIFKDLQAIADKIPIDIKLRLEKLGFDVTTLKGIEDASKGLVKVFDTIERSIRASAGLKGEQKELNDQIQAVRDSAEEVRNSFARQVGVIGTFREAAKKPVELAERTVTLNAEANEELKKVPAHLQAQVRLLQQINSAAERAKAQITGTFDPARFQSAILSLQGAAIYLAKFGAPEQAHGVQFLIEQLKKAAETAQNIQQITRGTEIQFGEADLQRLEDIFKAQGELANQNMQAFTNIGTAAQLGAGVANTAFDSINNSLQQIEEQARKTAAAVAAVGGGGTVEGKSLGGLIYRRDGGFIPRGTDTIPAMLTPGEFVVNAKASKKFFTQLVAINSGVKPAYRQEGGPVNNIGDINITVQGAPTPQQTARETMAAFRRETRRKTSIF